MSENRGVYGTEQAGLLDLDKGILTFCAAICPAVVGCVAAGKIVAQAKPWAFWAIIISIPTAFCFAWHIIRWPIRLHISHKNVTEACTRYADRMRKFLDEVAFPAGLQAAWGENDE